MVLVPAGSRLYAAEAMPLPKVFVLKATPLARNTTAPEGVSTAELTVAVRLTLEPCSEGLADELNNRVEGAGVTVAVPLSFAN